MEMNYLCDDNGTACFTRGHVPFDEFIQAAEQYYDAEDSILQNKPEHIWLRTTRDFQEGRTMYTEALPNSRGAFKATWIND